MRLGLLAFSLALASVAGCSTFAVTFVPYAPRGPTTDRAVWAYPGDVEAIAAAGGEYVGSLQATVRRVSEGDRIERIVDEAARVGGAHVVLVDQATHERIVGYQAIIVNGGGVTTFRGRPTIQRWDRATYDVFYVPRERLRELPAPLQPY